MLAIMVKHHLQRRRLFQRGLNKFPRWATTGKDLSCRRARDICPRSGMGDWQSSRTAALSTVREDPTNQKIYSSSG